MIFGKEIYLGYTYYLGGELLNEPLYELPEHYQEIDETEIDDTNNILRNSVIKSKDQS